MISKCKKHDLKIKLLTTKIWTEKINSVCVDLVKSCLKSFWNIYIWLFHIPYFFHVVYSSLFSIAFVCATQPLFELARLTVLTSVWQFLAVLEHLSSKHQMIVKIIFFNFYVHLFGYRFLSFWRGFLGYYHHRLKPNSFMTAINSTKNIRKSVVIYPQH